MKEVKCPFCFHRKEVGDYVVLVICKYCLVEMKEEEKDGRSEERK